MGRKNERIKIKKIKKNQKPKKSIKLSYALFSAIPTLHKTHLKHPTKHIFAITSTWAADSAC